MQNTRKNRLRNLCFHSCLIATVLTANIYIASAAEPEHEEHEEIDVTSKKAILKFNGETLEPSSLHTTKANSSIFFVNHAESQAVQLEIDFRGKSLHCHSENLKLEEDGFLKTIKAIKPFDFAVLCFPTLGKYFFSVSEVNGEKRVLKGEVIISE